VIGGAKETRLMCKGLAEISSPERFVTPVMNKIEFTLLVVA
jgi:hypothetical protein